jgi:hypothetical protein
VGHKGVSCYDPISRWLRVTRDIVFDEQAQWGWGKNEQAGDLGANTFTIEYFVLKESSVVEGTEEVADG